MTDARFSFDFETVGARAATAGVDTTVIDDDAQHEAAHAIVAVCEAAAARNTAMLERLHASRYECETWESWTETDVPLMEGGHADVRFVGCREHGVKVAVTDK